MKFNGKSRFNVHSINKTTKQKMKKQLICAVAGLALASCSSDSLVGESPVSNEAPIAFTAGQRNITRASSNPAALENNGYYNFGVFAYKVNGDASQNVMTNYLVGYNGTKGYPKDGVEADAWYYEGLNSQILRYWDYSYPTTNFYAYAPYVSGTTFNETDKSITVDATAGYAPSNDVIYAGKTVSKDAGYGIKVPLEFKHIGAKVMIAFRETIPGYEVELINVKDDSESGKGIQLTPAVYKENKYTKGEYDEKAKVTIDYDAAGGPATNSVATKTSSDNLKFDLPATTKLSDSDYKASTTTYYAVVQSNENLGFTLHVSYKLIAEDNKEEIIVRDARVFIPANQVKWKSNTAYTYNFTITTKSTGDTGGTVDVDSPVVPTDPALLPIVFDTPTIVEYEAASPINNEIN